MLVHALRCNGLILWMVVSFAVTARAQTATHLSLPSLAPTMASVWSEGSLHPRVDLPATLAATSKGSTELLSGIETRSVDLPLSIDASDPLTTASIDISFPQRTAQLVASDSDAIAVSSFARGHGVRLLYTPQATTFRSWIRLHVQVPNAWLGDVMLVRVTASTARRDQSLIDQTFVVGLYRDDAPAAQQAAEQMARCEAALAQSAIRYADDIRDAGHATLIHQFASAIRVAGPRVPNDWMELIVVHQADPSSHPALRRLPVDVRVAAIDYQEAQRRVQALAGGSSDAMLAMLPSD
jgi:hypothetical protein